MRCTQGKTRKNVLAVIALAWGFTILPGQPSWAKDPLFQATGVVHPTQETLAPEFSLPTPEGTSITLAQFRGQVVFLNFWATWCPPCRVEMPSMETVYKGFQDQGLAMLAIDIGESPKQVARFMKKLRLSFPALLDVDSRVSNRYSVRGLPTTILIDRRGRMVGAAVGARDWASPEAKALIRSLLDQKDQKG